MDSRTVFVFGLDWFFYVCVYKVCAILSSPQAVFLWFRMQRMCPITDLAHGPVGLMKSPRSSDHQACRAVGWESLRQMHAHPHTHTHT